MSLMKKLATENRLKTPNFPVDAEETPQPPKIASFSCYKSQAYEIKHSHLKYKRDLKHVVGIFGYSQETTSKLVGHVTPANTLVIFWDLETTGLDVVRNHTFEIGAVGRLWTGEKWIDLDKYLGKTRKISINKDGQKQDVELPTFQQYVFDEVDTKINRHVARICKIDVDTIKSTGVPFLHALELWYTWINDLKTQFRKKYRVNGLQFAAHYGSKFDVPMLINDELHYHSLTQKAQDLLETAWAWRESNPAALLHSDPMRNLAMVKPNKESWVQPNFNRIVLPDYYTGCCFFDRFNCHVTLVDTYTVVKGRIWEEDERPQKFSLGALYGTLCSPETTTDLHTAVADSAVLACIASCNELTESWKKDKIAFNASDLTIKSIVFKKLKKDQMK